MQHIKQFNESLDDERKELMKELSKINKEIRNLQFKYDEKIKEIHTIEDKISKKKKHDSKGKK